MPTRDAAAVEQHRTPRLEEGPLVTPSPGLADCQRDHHGLPVRTVVSARGLYAAVASRLSRRLRCVSLCWRARSFARVGGTDTHSRRVLRRTQGPERVQGKDDIDHDTVCEAGARHLVQVRGFLTADWGGGAVLSQQKTEEESGVSESCKMTRNGPFKKVRWGQLGPAPSWWAVTGSLRAVGWNFQCCQGKGRRFPPGADGRVLEIM